uniref:Secreted protein n=1 Tax=Caenorhabditis tropicalis TaxID=1561998 RepID=A0A1I7T9Z8_9PELO
MSRPLNLAILTILLGLVLINFCSAAPGVSSKIHSGMRLKKWYTWNNDLEVTKKWYDWQNVPHALQQKRQPFESTDYIIE